MLNHRQCASRDALLLEEAKRFLPDKEKLIKLIGALNRIQQKLSEKGISGIQELFNEYELKGLPEGVLSKPELALLQQVADRKHTIDYYLARLEQTIGNEIRLYETVSQQFRDLIRHRYAIIELIRHCGGAATALFDRLVTVADNMSGHLELRHSIIVPDLFVVLQNQKRHLRNRQWNLFERCLRNEKDIVRRLERVLSLGDDELQDMNRWMPHFLDAKLFEHYFSDHRLPTKLLSFVLIIETFLSKAQKKM